MIELPAILVDLGVTSCVLNWEKMIDFIPLEEYYQFDNEVEIY
jgi:hypothetical protein